MESILRGVLIADTKMHCIFCKRESSNSKSIEHIIPESLGNNEHVLQRGIVCDKCNNYISREIEKPLLNSLYFKERRFYAGIPNKGKKIPAIDGIHLQSLTHIQLIRSLNESGISFGAAPNADETHFRKIVRTQKTGTLIFPMSVRPGDYIISRFIAKVGLEALAQRLHGVPGGLDEIIDNPALDKLRQYVRVGSPSNCWPYSYRSIYPPDFLFKDGCEVYEVLHEYDILVTEQDQYYIILVIFGDEYALNLGEPEIEGYHEWLKINNQHSPLYCDKII